MMLSEELSAVMASLTGLSQVGFVEAPHPLSGGFYTENHAFRIDAPPPWDRPMVLRLFPAAAPSEAVHREAAVQRVLAEQGFPTPRVVHHDGTLLAGRRYFVMVRLDGGPMLTGIGPRDLLTTVPQLLKNLAATTCDVLTELHAVDPTDALAAVGAVEWGLDRWFVRLDEAVSTTAPGLGPGLHWLVAHRPTPASDEVVCHGDMHPGNMLVSNGSLTGVLDWTNATIAEPAFDLGAATLPLRLTPIDVPGPVRRVVAAAGGRIGARLLESYRRATGATLQDLSYYEALRCINELVGVAAFRVGVEDPPRPTPWDSVADDMVDYFRTRTGITLVLPDRSASPT